MRKQLPIVAVVLLLWNSACNSDESGVTQVQSQNKITLTDLDHEPAAKELVSKLQSKGATGRVSAIKVTDAFFKYEDLDSGILNYTFKLPDDSPDYFENLVLSKYDDGFYGFVYRYIPEGDYSDDAQFKGILQLYNLEGGLIRELPIPFNDSTSAGGRTQLINQCIRSVEQTCVTTYEVETVTDYPCHCQYDRKTEVSKVCTFSFNMGWCDDMIATPPAGGGGTYIGASEATPHSGGSGGTNSPKPVKNPIVVVPKNDDIIYDKVKSPCLRMVVKKLVSNDLTNDINKAIISIFGANPKMNLIIEEDPNLTVPGRTESTQNNDSFSVTIRLSSVLQNSSDEYVTSVIYHEAMHAYLNAKGYTPDKTAQHVEIAEKYIGWLSDAFQEIFPTLSTKESLGLALRGLKDLFKNNPEYFKDLINSYQFENMDELIQITDQYRNGTKGHSCL